jgi:hypothetical protein
MVNSRKVSVPQLFNELAHMDSELQVHSQFSKFRKMSATEEQMAWLQSREEERARKHNDYVDGLLAAEGGGGGKKGEVKKEAKGKGGKKDAKKAPPVATVTKKPTGPKYSSAADFMEKHFPNFDGEEFPDAQGVLR